MTKNTLLIALTAGLLAASSATFAQTSSGNSTGADSSGAMSQSTDGTAAPTKKHRAQRHGTNKSSNGLSANKSKTPAVETGASAAVENGQGK
ncbi:hypothetical protein AWB64_05001 [Caballeronia sordidicola]|uniref:Uncharacterized protein n=1 Tax=Caballeronia sordidicola TaxID=196367 RepID=A0A158HT45_CABSO|nr:hypothetical protein [Caballeronia sordidicola]SAL47506.1 hypothetical protein AWB64_05001 [Caballeronia sordidicola]